MIKFKSGIFPSLEILSPKDNEILTLLLLLLISVGYKSSNKQSSSHNRGYNKPNYSWMHCRHLDCLSVRKAAKNWVIKQNPSHSSSVHYLGRGVRRAGGRECNDRTAAVVAFSCRQIKTFEGICLALAEKIVQKEL